MRKSALALTLVATLVATSAGQQRPALSGHRYAIVIPPTYDNGETDAYGLAAHLATRLREDNTWELIGDLAQISAEKDKVAQTAIFGIHHETGLRERVFVVISDVGGHELARLEGTATSWTVNGSKRRALDSALKKLRDIRPRFDPGRARTLEAVLGNPESKEVTEGQMRSYFSSKAATLHPLEGIWTDDQGTYRLAITRETENMFVATVLASKHPLWAAGMVKARFEALATGTSFIGHYRMGDHQEQSLSFRLDRGTLVGEVKDRGDGKPEQLQFLRVEPSIASTTVASAPTAVSTGTAFMVAPGLMATNYHVIEGGKAWEVTFPSSVKKLALALVVADRANDLALMRVVGDLSSAPRPLAVGPSRAARLGEEVYAVGFPLAGVLSTGHKVATGVVSATAGIDDDPRLFQITVPTQPGNSGGPIFNSKGEVVGVLASTLSVEFLYKAIQHIPQNVNFAIKSDYLLLLLGQAEAEATKPMSLKMSSNRADQIEESQGSIGQITAVR